MTKTDIVFGLENYKRKKKMKHTRTALHTNHAASRNPDSGTLGVGGGVISSGQYPGLKSVKSLKCVIIQ